MSKVLVIGHRNPDTDAIGSAIGLARLEQALGVDAEAVALGSPGRETAFALDHFGLTAPRVIEYASPHDVMLVDHNERQQSVADIADVTEMLRELGVAAYKEPRLRELLLDEPSVMGVESLEVDQLSVRMVARTLPGKQFQVGRLLRARIARALREQGITVTPQLDTASVVDRVEAQ